MLLKNFDTYSRIGKSQQLELQLANGTDLQSLSADWDLESLCELTMIKLHSTQRHYNSTFHILI